MKRNRIHLLRHGQFIRGEIKNDGPLTSLGRRQARYAAKRIRRCRVRLRSWDGGNKEFITSVRSLLPSRIGDRFGSEGQGRESPGLFDQVFLVLSFHFGICGARN